MSISAGRMQLNRSWRWSYDGLAIESTGKSPPVSVSKLHWLPVTAAAKIAKSFGRIVCCGDGPAPGRHRFRLWCKNCIAVVNGASAKEGQGAPPANTPESAITLIGVERRSGNEELPQTRIRQLSSDGWSYITRD